MSVASEITRINTNIANAYTKALGKGATAPTKQNSENLVSCIESITGGGSGGGSSTIEKGLIINSIDENGYVTDASIVGMTTIPNSYLRYSAYEETSFLGKIGSNLHLSDDITSIGEYAFSDCKKLAITKLPNSLISIRKEAFDDCDNLAITKLPSGLKEIGERGFYSCDNLVITELPSSLTTIGASVFQACHKIPSLNIPANCTISGSATYNGSFQSMSGLTEVTLGAPGVPYTQTKAGKYAFYSCSNLSKIIMYTSDGTGTADYFYKTTSTYHTIEFRQA